MRGIQLTLLGGFQARLACGTPIPIRIGKAQGLLAYLALSPGEAVPRERLAALLWSDRVDRQAHGSLRHTLTLLRQALTPVEPRPLVFCDDSVLLDPAAVRTDAVRMLRLANAATTADLEAAIELYSGDLLDGFASRDPAFDAWLDETRWEFRETFRQALVRLLGCRIGDGAWPEAVPVARRLLALDPLQEHVHRALMRAYGATGRHAAALRQYQLCRDLLADELGAAPEAETETLHRAIRDGAEITRTTDPLPESPPTAVLRFAKSGR